MSDNDSERLKEFRAQAAAGRGATRWGIVQTAVLVAGFAVVIAAQFWMGRENRGQGTPGPAISEAAGGLSVDQLRQYALYLEEKKLPREAIGAYEAFLDKAALENDVRAKLCYSVAKLAVDSEQYEKALAYLYEAEMLAPESDLKDDINKKVVLCLDKLGRPVDLRRELRERTAVKQTAADVGSDEVVLAEFAGQVITNRDLDLEIEKLPPSVRESVDTPEKRGELLKNMVAERLLLDKALRLELDKDPEIQKRLAEQRDGLIVRKLIDDEVRAKVHVTPEDAERFYRAGPQRFTEPATAQVVVGKADTEEAAAALKDFPDKPVTVRKGAPGSGPASNAEANEAIFATEPEQTTKPIHIGDAWYVFRVASKTAERLVPFEEVKDQALRMLQMQKEQEQVRALVEETVGARDVSLHLDRLEPKESSGK